MVAPVFVHSAIGHSASVNDWILTRRPRETKTYRSCRMEIINSRMNSGRSKKRPDFAPVDAASAPPDHNNALHRLGTRSVDAPRAENVHNNALHALDSRIADTHPLENVDDNALQRPMITEHDSALVFPEKKYIMSRP